MAGKILYCASTVSHLLNFHLPYLRAFHEMGYEVWVAAEKEMPVPYADQVVALPFRKKITSPENIRAVLAARKMMKEQNFDLVSTHTMLASAVIRAGILMLRSKPKVVCTIHGYLFHESDGPKKWIYLFPEKLCARVTDVLMVMNREDYRIAKRHKLYRDKLVSIDGMGIDLTKFSPITPEERCLAREKLGISKEDFVFVYAAEFSERKNQAFLIRSFAEINRKNPKMKLFLAGTGTLLQECRNLACQLDAGGQIRFMGYVKNMRYLYSACDACVSVSRIEGLPFNLMEAMACGLPIIASDIKGHSELIENGKSGLLFQNAAEMENQIKRLQNDENLRNSLREAELFQVTKFALPTVFPDVMNQYRVIL
jgi:glycosyltransferase EpsD